MSTLLAGLLSAALSTNPPLAVSNLVAEETGLAVPVANTNDPVDVAYRKVLHDDDDAERDVLKWSEEADAAAAQGVTDPKVTLHNRIRQRLLGIKDEYEDFIARYPNHAHIRLAYGSFLTDTHDEDGAVVQWEKAKELDPKNPAVWDDLANYYGHNGSAKKAFEYYEKAIELNSHQPVYYENLAMMVYLFRSDAREYYHCTDKQVFDRALENYRKAIKLDPDNFVLSSDYAQCFYGLNPPRWDEGLVAWQQALKVARDDAEREGVYIHLARIHLKLGQFDEARQSLTSVTNAIYTPLKIRITKNIADAINKNVISAPTD